MSVVVPRSRSGKQMRQDFTMLARFEVRSLDPRKALLPAGGDRILRRGAIGQAVRRWRSSGAGPGNACSEPY